MDNKKVIKSLEDLDKNILKFPCSMLLIDCLGYIDTKINEIILELKSEQS